MEKDRILEKASISLPVSPVRMKGERIGLWRRRRGGAGVETLMVWFAMLVRGKKAKEKINQLMNMWRRILPNRTNRPEYQTPVSLP